MTCRAGAACGGSTVRHQAASGGRLNWKLWPGLSPSGTVMVYCFPSGTNMAIVCPGATPDGTVTCIVWVGGAVAALAGT